jgi:hypothetical protein
MNGVDPPRGFAFASFKIGPNSSGFAETVCDDFPVFHAPIVPVLLSTEQ